MNGRQATVGRKLSPMQEQDPREDVNLLEAIARDRDEAAMTELFRRHHRAVYGLARRITQQADRAEDVVQEAMIVVWTSAGNYRETGLVRSWLLRIVALKGLQAMRSERRESQRAEKKAELHPASAALSQEAATERKELMAALQREIGGLPAAQQRVLALHYGGGISRREIGEALELSRQSIDVLIKKAVDRLRGNLCRAGLAASAPVLSAEALGEAVCSGPTVPAGLMQRLSENVARSVGKAAAARHSVRAGVAVKSSGTLAISVAFIAVCGTAVWWLSSATSTNRSQEQDVWKAGPVVERPDAKAPEREPLRKVWSFEKGAPKGFTCLSGKGWAWREGTGKLPGVMAVGDYEKETLFKLPVETPRDPFIVDVKLRCPFKKKVGIWNWHLGVMWLPSIRSDKFAAWKWKKNELDPWRFDSFRAWFKGSYVVEKLNRETLFFVQQYKRTPPGSDVVLIARNILIERIEIRELRESELPAFMRDPEALTRELVPVSHVDLISDGKATKDP